MQSLCISDARGDIGPFQVAIGLTVLCLVLVLLWEENTGASDEAHARRKGSGAAATAAAVVEAPPSLLEDARQSVAAITASPGVLLVGLSQACYEGAVFTFGEKNLKFHLIRSLKYLVHLY